MVQMRVKRSEKEVSDKGRVKNELGPLCGEKIHLQTTDALISNCFGGWGHDLEEGWCTQDQQDSRQKHTHRDMDMDRDSERDRIEERGRDRIEERDRDRTEERGRDTPLPDPHGYAHRLLAFGAWDRSHWLF